MVRITSALLKMEELTFRSLACALRQDLALLPNGDLTEVGEKGITVRNPWLLAWRALNPNLWSRS